MCIIEEISPTKNYGWTCPNCNKVYSPTVPCCFTCGNNTITSLGDK